MTAWTARCSSDPDLQEACRLEEGLRYWLQSGMRHLSEGFVNRQWAAGVSGRASSERRVATQCWTGWRWALALATPCNRDLRGVLPVRHMK